MAVAQSIMQAKLRVTADKSDFAQVPKMIDIATQAGTNIATKNFVKGANDRQKVMEQNIKKSTQASKQNDQELVKNTETVAKRAAKAANEAVPKRPPPPKPGKPDTAPLKAHRVEYIKSMKAMGQAYAKFTQDAAKMGMKVPKSARGWGGREAGKFAKAGAEDRGAQIDRVRTLVSEQKRHLKGLDKETEEYQEQRLVLEHLERQQLDMMNIDRDKVRAEKKHAKIKKDIDNDLKAAAKAKKKSDKAENRRLKINIQALKEAAHAVKGYANSVGDTLRNAFLLGTAAATAFFYKMQPVVEQVMEFEKELMNAQSIFQVHRAELHELSDVVTEFGLQYGIAYDTAVKGLYQYASAGVEASEANEMLAHTLKLSMAVQGDHEALAKLTTQTIMGFSMEFSQAEEITDKFAHAINKSLIEWDDLASSVKFALPFFISTGQSIDQLLGSLQILTNRALEAGIAGRGLRQALAEFTQHAEDNAAAFNRMGVSILDMQGNMKPLTNIAQQFKDLMGENVNDMDIMMALMEDLNIRGATAFVHLVQNAEDFQAAVDDLANASGTATEMAEIQQQSLSMQIQRVKNALIAPFLFSDKIGEANDTLNEFTLLIKELVDEMVGFFIIEDEMGNRLTQHGEEIRTFVVEALKVAVEVVRELRDVFLENGDGLKVFTNLLHLSTKPMMILLGLLEKLGPRSIELLVWYKLLNGLLPINTVLMGLNSLMKYKLLIATQALDMGTKKETVTLWQNVVAWRAKHAAMLGPLALFAGVVAAIAILDGPLLAMASALFLAAGAWMAFHTSWSLGAATATIAAGLALGTAAFIKLKDAAGGPGAGISTGAPSYTAGGISLSTAEGASGIGPSGSTPKWDLSNVGAMAGGGVGYGSPMGGTVVNVNVEGNIVGDSGVEEMVTDYIVGGLDGIVARGGAN